MMWMGLAVCVCVCGKGMGAESFGVCTAGYVSLTHHRQHSGGRLSMDVACVLVASHQVPVRNAQWVSLLAVVTGSILVSMLHSHKLQVFDLC
jgi:hypothetical protein